MPCRAGDGGEIEEDLESLGCSNLARKSLSISGAKVSFVRLLKNRLSSMDLPKELSSGD